MKELEKTTYISASPQAIQSELKKFICYLENPKLQKTQEMLYIHRLLSLTNALLNRYLSINRETLFNLQNFQTNKNFQALQNISYLQQDLMNKDIKIIKNFVDN